jgi:uncharacterized membrane protein
MGKKVKNIFLAGLAVVIPVGVTDYILAFIVGMMDSFLAVLPGKAHPDRMLGFHVPGLGVVFTVLLVFLAGLIARSWLGYKVVGAGERLVTRIPVVKNIYQATKQLVDALLGGKVRDFKKLVLIEFPRTGVYTLAFVTGRTVGEAQEKTGEGRLNVFVPTTPNPTSGYYLIVPEEETVDLDMKVEDALKLLISGGLIVPERGKAVRGE